MTDEQKIELDYLYRKIREVCNALEGSNNNFVLNESELLSIDKTSIYRNLILKNNSRELRTNLLQNSVCIEIKRSYANSVIEINIFYERSKLDEYKDVIETYPQEVYLLGERERYEDLMSLIYSRMLFTS